MGSSASKNDRRRQSQSDSQTPSSSNNQGWNAPPPSYYEILIENQKFQNKLSAPLPSPTSSSSQNPRRTPVRRGTREDALQTLRKFDTVIIVDDSESMQGHLWDEATAALSQLAQTAGEYDTDGIDIYFLNDEHVGHNMKDPREVRKLFQSVEPEGYTPIGERLENIIRPYLYKIEQLHDSQGPAAVDMSVKPMNLIVITDGVPTDEPAAVIEAAALRLDKRNFPLSQLGIQFVQIGNNKQAALYLEELDNDLAKGSIRDIVDTTQSTGGPLTEYALIKILLGGINRRIDNKGPAVEI